MVLTAMKAKGHTNRFKAFCKSDTMDSFLHACIDYFAVFFELKQIEEEEQAAALAERRDALAEGKAPPAEGSVPSDATTPPPAATSAETRELIREKELEKRDKIKDVSLVYATILLKHSNYANTQQEQQFFESLYDFAKRVLFTINNRKNWHAIENELDRVFRSPHFNLSQRKNDANLKGGSNTLSFREMFEKSQEGRPLFGDGKNHRSSIHQALQMRSPIISEIFPTPKDRAARAKELAELRRGSFAAEADPAGPGGTHGAEEMGWAADSTRTGGGARGTSRDAHAGVAAAAPLEGEEAMEALVNEAHARFAEEAGI
jgi:hypothetical protein